MDPGYALVSPETTHVETRVKIKLIINFSSLPPVANTARWSDKTSHMIPSLSCDNRPCAYSHNIALVTLSVDGHDYPVPTLFFYSTRIIRLTLLREMYLHGS